MHVCSLFYTFILKNKYDFYLLEYLLDFMLLGLAKNRQYLSEIRYLSDYCGISIFNIKQRPRSELVSVRIVEAENID